MVDEFELEKLKGDKKIPRSIMFKRMMKYVKPEWPSLLFAFVIVIIGVAIDVLFPIFMQHLTNTLQVPTNETMKIVLMIAVGYLVLAILFELACYVEAMILQDRKSVV